MLPLRWSFAAAVADGILAPRPWTARRMRNAFGEWISLLQSGIISLWLLAGVLLAPTLVFCAQCLLSLLPARRRPDFTQTPCPVVAVLIPAHDEHEMLGTTLDLLRPQLGDGDHVLVVADNCSDDTADIARAHGAEVVERHDAAYRGKGYALSFGLDTLRDHAFDVLVILDADSRIKDGTIDALARQVAATGRPAQAVYLMRPCDNPSPRDGVSAWAFMVKNLVRPMGLGRIGLPCPLTGTGMAFPRAAMTKISVAGDNLVEDMQLGLDLALARCAPRLCPAASVTGQLPRDTSAALGQRRRWEHGHLRTIFVQAPRMLWRGITRFNLVAIAMAIDLMVPPLSLLMMLLLLGAAVAYAAAWLWRLDQRPAASITLGAIAVVACVLLTWIKFGRKTLPATNLPAVASYVLWKLPMYLMFFLRPEKKWVRTPRDADSHLPDPAKTPA